MEPDTFQYHCKQWFGKLVEMNEHFLESLFKCLQVDSQTNFPKDKTSFQNTEDCLLQSHGQAMEFFSMIRPLEEACHDQLRQNPWDSQCKVAKSKIKSHQDNNSSNSSESQLYDQYSKTLFELAHLPQLEEQLLKMSTEHPCQNQVRMALHLFRSMLLLASKYWRDYEKLTWGATEMITAMGKLLSLHVRRSLINSFVVSMQKCFDEIVNTKVPREIRQVEESQAQILQYQKMLYQNALDTFEIDVKHFQQLIQMLATIPFESEVLSSISKRFTELSLFVQGCAAGAVCAPATHGGAEALGDAFKEAGGLQELKIFPILQDVHRVLNELLTELSEWMNRYTSAIANVKEPSLIPSLDEKALATASSLAAEKNKNRSHVAILLQYIDKMHQEEKSKQSHLETALQQLSNVQNMLKKQVVKQDHQQKEAFAQCLEGKTKSDPVCKKFIQAQQVVDPLIAKQLLTLDHTLEEYKLQRQLARQKLIEKKILHSHTSHNVSTLKHVIHFLKLWEQRDQKWRHLIRQEITLLSSWKNMRRMYFHSLCEKKNRWHSVSKMELSILHSSNQLIAQDMMKQVQEFQQLQWQLLQEKNKQLFRHISLLSVMFKRIMRQTSLLCTPETRQLYDYFQQIELILTQLETYWNLRYQKDVMRAFRKNATFFYALVTLLIKDNRDPQTAFHRYTLLKDKINRILEDQESQIAKFSFPSKHMEKNFQQEISSQFNQFLKQEPI